MKDIKKGSRNLHQTVAETSTSLNKLQLVKQQLYHDLEQMTEQVEQVAELEKEKEKLAREVSSLKTATDALECENQGLILENQRLQQTLESSSQKSQAQEQELGELEAESQAPQQGPEAQQLATKQLGRPEEEAQLAAAYEALLQEHTCLGSLHEHLSGEYEALKDEHSRQKTLLHRTVELVHKSQTDRCVPAAGGQTGGLPWAPVPPSLWPLEFPLDLLLHSE